MNTGKKVFLLCLWLLGQCEPAKDKYSTMIFIVHYLEADCHHQFLSNVAVLVANLLLMLFHMCGLSRFMPILTALV